MLIGIAQPQNNQHKDLCKIGNHNDVARYGILEIMENIIFNKINNLVHPQTITIWNSLIRFSCQLENQGYFERKDFWSLNMCVLLKIEMNYIEMNSIINQHFYLVVCQRTFGSTGEKITNTYITLHIWLILPVYSILFDYCLNPTCPAKIFSPKCLPIFWIWPLLTATFQM